MTVISEPNKKHLITLKNKYSNLPGYTKIFFPKILATALSDLDENAPTIDQAKRIFYACINLKSPHQKWFFSCIADFCITDFYLGVELIHYEGMLNGESGDANFASIAGALNSDIAARALNIMNNASLLGELGYREAIMKHQHPICLASAFITAHHAGLLTGTQGKANCDSLTRQTNINYLSQTLEMLNEAGLLNGEQGQLYFNALITYTNIFFDDPSKYVFWIVPRHLLTADTIQQMIRIAEQHQRTPTLGQTAMRNYVNQLIGIIPSCTNVFNGPQSTHTASIHQSVSASANRLMESYGANISLNKQIEKITKWTDELPSGTLKHDAAKRCIRRITALEFQDPKSHVSLKQLLALAWLAVHDNTKRQGTLEDAKLLLLDGFYEIQRGYNLSSSGVDDQSKDKSICISGTFNKLIEKLGGIHSDIQLFFITDDGAAVKFQIIVQEEARLYLTALGATELKNMLIKIRAEENFMPMWTYISDKVENRIFEEFGCLYPEGNKNERFIGLMAANIDVPIDGVVNNVEGRHSMSKNSHTFFSTVNDTIPEERTLSSGEHERAHARVFTI